MTVAAARSAWTAAGFTGSFSPQSGQNKRIVNDQSLPAGACRPADSSISVGTV